jgi:hypothetical protein
VTNSHVYRSFQKLRQNEPSLAMFLAGSAPNAVLELDESSKVASRRFRVDDGQYGSNSGGPGSRHYFRIADHARTSRFKCRQRLRSILTSANRTPDLDESEIGRSRLSGTARSS